MPPDLVALGDQLEAAAARALARRRARRLTFFNAAASLLVALPVAFAFATADLRPSSSLPASAPPVSEAAAVSAARTTIVESAVTEARGRDEAPVRSRPLHEPDDPPQVLRRPVRTSELLLLPTTLRPALR